MTHRTYDHEARRRPPKLRMSLAGRLSSRRRLLGALRGVGLRPVQALWMVYSVVAVAAIVTYWRMPLGTAYHFADSGASGGASRFISYLNFPVAVAAIAIAWAVCSRRAALLVTVLCGCALVPGVVRSSDLTAQWVNVPAAAGVVVAAVATLRAHDTGRRPLSRARVAALVVLAVWSIPWMFAAMGLYTDGVPLLGRVLMSSEPTPGQKSLAAVHFGLHDGFLGAMLAATALILSSRRLRTALSLYLSLMLVYGLAMAANDSWDEQFVKRGWSHTQLPNIMQPAVSVPWLGLLISAVVVHRLWFGRERAAAPPRQSTPV